MPRRERIVAAAEIEAAQDLLLGHVWSDNEDVRLLKSLILFGLRGAAAYAYHARMLGSVSDEAQQAFVDCLATLATESDLNKLLAVSMQVGKLSHDVMGLLDAANTGAYGMPEPTEVSLKIEKGPFIVISAMTSTTSSCSSSRPRAQASTSIRTARCCPPTPIPSSSAIRSSRATLAPHGRISRRSSPTSPLPLCSPRTASCLLAPATQTSRLHD